MLHAQCFTPRSLPAGCYPETGLCAVVPAPESGSKMNKLIFANLLHRPLRSIISVLAVAIEVIMILSIVGIFMGMLNDQKQRTNGIGADLMLLPSNASFFNGLASASMPVKDADVLRRLPHVAVVSPAIQKISTNGSVEILYGIDYPSFNALKPFIFLAGGPFQGPNDVIVDDHSGQQQESGNGQPYEVGDTITILGHPFRISGIVEQGKGGRKLIPIDTMAADDRAPRARLRSSTSSATIRPTTDRSCRRFTPRAALKTTPLTTVDSWLDQMTPSKIPGFNLALEVVTGIAVIIGFLVIFQSMYTAVLERTREIGILKSMGASKVAIVGVVLRESAVLARSA